MLNVDESALECDFAETYHIYDYRELPLDRVALFAVGLREDSRIKMKMNGLKCPYNTLFLARCSDALSMLVWFQSKDGAEGINRPELLTNKLIGLEEEREYVVFDSPDDFEQARRKIIKGGD